MEEEQTDRSLLMTRHAHTHILKSQMKHPGGVKKKGEKGIEV